MLRKIWVRRPNASPTLVRVEEESFVDEVRDVILTKYANSLGRDFDAPDISLRVVARAEGGKRRQHQRVLDPQEKICAVIDHFYPGGQTAQDALLIDIATEGSDSGHDSAYGDLEASQRSNVPLNTAYLSPLPSPSGTKRPRDPRPRSQRYSTSSSVSNPHPSKAPAVSVSSPPGEQQTSLPTPPQPRPSVKVKEDRPRKAKSILGDAVPAINVLIVDDNHISLRLLQEKMKKMKVPCQTATNGQIALEKWRSGGFHLIFMDLQMPVMNGLVATKEIRRLEAANGIGILTPGSGKSPAEAPNRPDDQLNISAGSFKSSVIIVALTASSHPSDRNEALAAGCNDFVTKPINPEWLERKLKEWGSMQALIDFEGWKKWKAQQAV